MRRLDDSHPPPKYNEDADKGDEGRSLYTQGAENHPAAVFNERLIARLQPSSAQLRDKGDDIRGDEERD